MGKGHFRVYFCRRTPLAAVTSRATVSSQQPEPSQSQAPAERVPLPPTVRAVVVDVVVTNEGEPVRWPDQDKFQVQENGEPQKINYFEDTPGSPPPPSPTSYPSPTQRLHQRSHQQDDRLGRRAAGRQLLDTSAASPIRVDIDSRPRSISTGEPGTRSASFALSTRLRFVQGFTADATMLRAALRQIPSSGAGPQSSACCPPEPKPRQQHMTAQIESFQQTTRQSASAMLPNRRRIDALKQFQADSASFQTSQRIEITLDAFQRLGRYLAGTRPRRRHLVRRHLPPRHPAVKDVNQNRQNAPQSPSANSFSSVRDFDERSAEPRPADRRTVAIYLRSAKGPAPSAPTKPQHQYRLRAGGKGLSRKEPQAEAPETIATRNSMDETAQTPAAKTSPTPTTSARQSPRPSATAPTSTPSPNADQQEQRRNSTRST